MAKGTTSKASKKTTEKETPEKRGAKKSQKAGVAATPRGPEQDKELLAVFKRLVQKTAFGVKGNVAGLVAGPPSPPPHPSRQLVMGVIEVNPDGTFHGDLLAAEGGQFEQG